MPICPHCYAHFETRTVRAGLGEDDQVIGGRLSEMMAGYKAVQTGVTKGVSNQDLFEAAIGTLSIVAKEVPDLQAAKIRGAIDVLMMCL